MITPPRSFLFLMLNGLRITVYFKWSLWKMTFLFSLSPLPINIEPNPERDQIRDPAFCDTLPAKLGFASCIYEVRHWETMRLVQEGSANDKLLPCRSEHPGCGVLSSLFPFQAPSMSVLLFLYQILFILLSQIPSGFSSISLFPSSPLANSVFHWWPQ